MDRIRLTLRAFQGVCAPHRLRADEAVVRSVVLLDRLHLDLLRHIDTSRSVERSPSERHCSTSPRLRNEGPRGVAACSKPELAGEGQRRSASAGAVVPGNPLEARRGQGRQTGAASALPLALCGLAPTCTVLYFQLGLRCGVNFQGRISRAEEGSESSGKPCGDGGGGTRNAWQSVAVHCLL
jgi:hypothetical protein